MKVRCIKNFEGQLLVGALYDVLSSDDTYYYIDGGVGGGGYEKHRFTVIPETTQIEVGSEWVSDDGAIAIVKYASEHTVVFGEKDDCYDTKHFIEDFKPKPKTVTMYFYKDCKGLVHSYSEVMPVFGDYLFTREVEL